MKYLIFILGTLLTWGAVAEDQLVFSSYDKALRYEGVTPSYGAQFRGQIKISGVLAIDFERNEAIFLPDANSQKLLPSVIKGRDPKSVESIEISYRAKDVLSSLLTKQEVIDLLFSEERKFEFESPAVAVIQNFSTKVACDHRVYIAELVSISLLKNKPVSSLGGADFSC